MLTRRQSHFTMTWAGENKFANIVHIPKRNRQTNIISCSIKYGDGLWYSKQCPIHFYSTPKLAPPNFVSLKGTFDNCLIDLTVAHTPFRGLGGWKIRHYYFTLSGLLCFLFGFVFLEMVAVKYQKDKDAHRDGAVGKVKDRPKK